MKRLTIDERIARDGNRWRYILMLEDELERRKSRLNVLRGVSVYAAVLTLIELGRIFYNLS